jgi:hypothetical protein
VRDTVGTVYLLHFDTAVPRLGTAGVRHYLGWTAGSDVAKRLHRHATAKDSAVLVRELRRRGGRFVLARVWRDQTPEDERRRKKMGHLEAMCDVCRGRVTPAEGDWM